MSERVIGVAAMGDSSTQVVETVRALERRGVPAAGVQTGRIKLGTSIVPTRPRHPIAMVQQVQVLAQLTPGRFRLGVGPSHRAGMQQMFGASFEAPLTNLREYLTIIKSLLHQGQVEFDGCHYHAHAAIQSPAPDVPVMASALREASFELCGELADGAISWVCPGEYLSSVCLPALQRGAEQAGRDAPPLIAHTPVCVRDSPDEGAVAVREQLGRYAQIPLYARTFEAAGFPEALSGHWSDGMGEAAALSGREEQVAERLRGLFDMGVGEVLVSVFVAGKDREASRERTLRFLADFS